MIWNKSLGSWQLGSLHDFLTSLLTSAILIKFRTDKGIGCIATNPVISSKFQTAAGRNPLRAWAGEAGFRILGLPLYSFLPCLPFLWLIMLLLLLRAVVWQERGPAAASEVVVVAPSGSFAHHISGEIGDE